MNKLNLDQTRFLIGILEELSEDNYYLDPQAINILYNEKLKVSEGDLSFLEIPYSFFIKDLINEKYVITSFSKKNTLIRYYPFMFSENRLIKAFHLENHSRISTRKLFKDNLELMEKLDIREDSELYDIFRKYIDLEKHDLKLSKPNFNIEPIRIGFEQIVVVATRSNIN